MFRQDYRKVDLKLANNGEFLPKLDKLEDKARKAYVTAKKAEIEKKGDRPALNWIIEFVVKR